MSLYVYLSDCLFVKIVTIVTIVNFFFIVLFAYVIKLNDFVLNQSQNMQWRQKQIETGWGGGG